VAWHALPAPAFIDFITGQAQLANSETRNTLNQNFLYQSTVSQSSQVILIYQHNIYIIRTAVNLALQCC